MCYKYYFVFTPATLRTPILFFFFVVVVVVIIDVAVDVYNFVKHADLYLVHEINERKSKQGEGRLHQRVS